MLIGPSPSARLPAGRVHFIIGAMKCGTTSLQASLMSHPQVCPSRTKEPEFFSQDKVFRRGVDWYREQWPDWNAEIHDVALDATTSYTKSPRFPCPSGRIHEFNPAAKLIYLVRDPFERIKSHYMMSFANDWKLTPLDEGVDPFALAVSRYYYQLQRYRDYFRREAILVIDLADLSGDPAKNISRICDHLNISSSIGLSLEKLHSSDEEYLARCLDNYLLSRGMPECAAPDTIKELSGAASARYTLNGKNRDQVWRMLATDTKNLRREYGIDVSRWGFH